MYGGEWTPASKLRYNMQNAIFCCTVQVHPNSWTEIYARSGQCGNVECEI
ncbi:hypothetical protein RchiOBHm_Chr6g0267921 [Rosa chinensis]|uniref:Plastocyanin-like domain-containing protein n=1 Tax=Rosa chinensis TaxID=74649 RepID=A0A2P6PQ28_ROSCH|nr:hypothetical protein RchiOBHm_Chr6g0267921 [Rosa chinensis]